MEMLCRSICNHYSVYDSKKGPSPYDSKKGPKSIKQNDPPPPPFTSNVYVNFHNQCTFKRGLHGEIIFFALFSDGKCVF